MTFFLNEDVVIQELLYIYKGTKNTYMRNFVVTMGHSKRKIHAPLQINPQNWSTLCRNIKKNET